MAITNLHGIFWTIKRDRPLSAHLTWCLLGEPFSLLFIIILFRHEYNEQHHDVGGIIWIARGPTDAYKCFILYGSSGSHTENTDIQGKVQCLVINEAYEGARQILFGSCQWICLHLLVVVFCFLNYQLSDDLVNARTTFGITYRALFLP